MKKAVLLSIKPKYCELIASGQKTVEIRKNRPKIDVPFKCYIYCTKPKQFIYSVSMLLDELYRLPNGKIKFGCSMEVAGYDNYPYNYVLNGKVIGEFVCDFASPINRHEIITGCSERGEFELQDATRLGMNKLLDYLGDNDVIWGWHISDLVIYDKPKELSEFYRKCNGIHCCGNDCEHWKHVRANADEFDMDCDCNELPPIMRPPQSWCYVEELSSLS